MKFFNYIYSVYVWFVVIIYFVVVSFFIILLMALFPKTKVYKIIKFLLKGIFVLMFVRVRVEDEEQIDEGTNYLFMPNHVSILDAPLMFAYTPHIINALEAQEHFSWPLYGRIIKKWGNIPINRKNARSSYNSMMKVKDVLKKNSVIIYPEGGRTTDGKLKRLKKLPFYLAKEAEVSIVPIGVSGIFKINHKGSMLFSPGRIHIKFGKIISSKKIKETTENELIEKVKNQIETLANIV